MANLRLPGSYELNARETFSSGRPYTPYDMPDSLSQNRGIYDLSQLNGLRGPIYNRLDLEFGKRLRVGKAMLDLHGGADNILDRRNLLGYVWMPNCEASPECSSEGSPVSKIPQMGLYPAFSARYIF
jgi:hypothetical protein